MGLIERVFQGLILATAVTIPIATFNGTLFSWHPTLMSVGFLALMGNGVLTAFQFRQILEANTRVKAIQKHSLWQIAALACIGGGFFAIYQNKVRLGKFHFLTLHGKFGLLVTLLSFGAASGGTLAFRKLGLLQKLPSKLQPIIKAGHRSAGFVTFLLALVTIELALTHPSVWKGYGSVFWQLAVGLLGILALCFPFRFPPAPYELPSQHPPRTGFAARDDEEGHSLVLTQQDAVRAGRGAAPSD